MKIDITFNGRSYALIMPPNHRLGGLVSRLVTEISDRHLDVDSLIYGTAGHRIYNARQDLLLRAPKLKIR